MGVCGSDAGAGGGSVLPDVRLDRVRGVAGQSEKMLRDSTSGEVYRGMHGSRFESAGRQAGLSRMLDGAPEGRFAGGVVRAVLEFLTEVKPPGGS